MNPLRRSAHCILITAIIAITISCHQASTEATSKLKLDWAGLSDKIIERAQLQHGERVMMLAQPGDFDPLIELLAKKIPKAGGVYLGTVSVDSTFWPKEWRTEFIDTSLAASDNDIYAILDQFDLGIMLPGASPTHEAYKIVQAAVSQGVGRTIHFHWTGAYDFSGQLLPMTDAMDKIYQNAVLATDYGKLARVQKDFEDALRKDWVVVTTPAGTNIKFKIGDRPVTKQDGNAAAPAIPFEMKCLIEREIEIPAGAVRVAPLEGTIDGVIAMPDGVWSGEKVEGLVLTFKVGTVVEIHAKVGEDAATTEILDEEAAQSFREFVLGFNPLLAIPEGEKWIPYYGYGAGVVRLSLGNNQELGGEVYQGDYVRVNYFTDATVTIGNEVWVKDGKLVKGN